MSDDVLKEIDVQEQMALHHPNHCQPHVRKLARIARGEYAERIQMTVAWKAARERVDQAEAEVAVDDVLLAERNRLLDLFTCEAHGSGCVPHAIDEVHCLRAENERLREALKRKECPFDHAVLAANAVALCVNCGAALRGGKE